MVSGIRYQTLYYLSYSTLFLVHDSFLRGLIAMISEDQTNTQLKLHDQCLIAHGMKTSQVYNMSLYLGYLC